MSNNSKDCAFCYKRPAASKCSRCEETYYCNRECQLGHWKKHKGRCHPKRLDEDPLSKEQRLQQASKLGLNTKVQSLIAEGGVNVDYQNKVTGATSLCFAIESGSLDVVNELIAANADVNIPDGDQTTPLMLASSNGQVDIVLALLTAGADVNRVNNTGCGALEKAVEREHVEIVKLLLAHGANANNADKRGYDALYRASFKGNVELVQQLLDHGADAKRLRDDGIGALFIASHNGHLEIVQLLLAHGATGVSRAYRTAKDCRHPAIVDILTPLLSLSVPK